MIIDVALGADGEVRRYELRRDGPGFKVRLIDGAEPASSDSDGEPAASDTDGRAGDGTPASLPAETVIDWRRPEPGVYSILVDRWSYEVFVEDTEEHLAVHLLNRTFLARAVDARRRRGVAVERAIDGQVRITAPIPGRVAKILCPAGSRVQRGDGVIVLEAMKMENELRAPRDGVVVGVEVEEGQGVEGGTLLATIE